jgi:hypothetical protein
VNWIFGGIVRRRGTHVNIPKIGSRVGVFVPWGNLRFLRCFAKRIRMGVLFLGRFWRLWAVMLRGG